MINKIIQFLRKPRYFTDEKIGTKSRIQYQISDGGVAYTSYLGIINSILPKFSLLLIVEIDKEGKKANCMYLRRSR